MKNAIDNLAIIAEELSWTRRILLEKLEDLEKTISEFPDQEDERVKKAMEIAKEARELLDDPAFAYCDEYDEPAAVVAV